jgi:hypothetical protein
MQTTRNTTETQPGPSEWFARGQSYVVVSARPSLTIRA